VYIEFSSPTYVYDGRDRSVIKFFLPPKLGQPHAHDYTFRGQHQSINICILWSERRDQRITALLAALFIKERDLLEQLVGIGESRGRIDFYGRSPEALRDLQRAIDAAAHAVMVPWRANPGQAVPTTGTVVDWAALPETHPLKSTAKGQRLGRVAATGAQS
jgi:hypothetical protein